MELLKKLVEAYGVSGNEGEVRELIKNEISKCVDEVHTDKLGNLVAHKKGKLPRVMLAAHMDEIGLIIKRINERGKIVFSTVGGIEVSALIGQKVSIQTNKKNQLLGVITLDQMSSGDSIKELPRVTDLYIDTGLDREQLAELGVEIGNYVYFYDSRYSLATNEFIIGKSLDNRIGCYVLIELAKLLKENKNEIFYVFTVQEEIGMYGARTSAYTIDPSWAIAVDATTTDDVYATPTRSLKGGPCITVKDAGMLGNKCINDWLREIAKKSNIPIQYDVSEYGATDALTISLARGGIPSTTVSIPVRNIHTAVGMAHVSDIKNTIKLLELLLRKPPLVCVV
ncbi:MAG: M42 family metallopeptidase [Candidatus Aenigmarchaeota archaeon]|nr:M42 family metallopeptidase [Candidatus Aenigmarchaeota archaeon]